MRLAERRRDLQTLVADKLGCGTVPAGDGLTPLTLPAVAVTPASPYRIYLTACRASTVDVTLFIGAADRFDTWDVADDLTDELLDVLEASVVVGEITVAAPPEPRELAGLQVFAVTATVTLLA